MARPKEFDPDEALDQAMHVFWHKGYEATSVEDLLAAMDINRGSLYATFGDKRELFLKAMDRYCSGGGVGSRISILTQPGPALPLIRRFIAAMLEFGLSDPQRRGCLITNTVMELAPHEKDIARKVSGRFQMAEEAFFQLLTRAQREGELTREKDPRALARFLVTMMQGTIVMIKAGIPADQIRQTADTALSVLD
ncbi:MAG: TetR/AcrR family transcriptional regulator [Nitrospirota bacterium]|nr:TetR/AcrR family transcriptional regulator [Nitrospirota bacterium]MDE3118239.1 TetR/AcrR family transcriptional regulator [Nitrospirota bacterium]MDE3225553.1 TetR/AcrR family transcriptional regulator [Nitrospirota bacterium]MDE3244010.1 TetR/AcrR family transcriptional regulator [Nitrospirota bacterium]